MRREYLLSCFAPLGPFLALPPLREAVPAHSGTTAQHVVFGPLPQPHRRLSSLGAIGPSPLHSAFYLLRQLAFARECGAFGRDPCAAVAGESNHSRTGANLRCTYAPLRRLLFAVLFVAGAASYNENEHASFSRRLSPRTAPALPGRLRRSLSLHCFAFLSELICLVVALVGRRGRAGASRSAYNEGALRRRLRFENLGRRGVCMAQIRASQPFWDPGCSSPALCARNRRHAHSSCCVVDVSSRNEFADT